MLLTSSIGLSRLLEQDDPELAISLYPLNTDARVRHVAGKLAGEVDSQELMALQRQVQKAMFSDRIDSRPFSLLGEILSRLDGGDDAEALFQQASLRSRTDILSLHHMLVRAVEGGQSVDAVRYVDILLRRWPERFTQVSPLLPVLLADPAGYAAMLARLAENVPWRGRLIGSLAGEAETLPVAGRLLVDLPPESPPTSAEIATSINGYIAQRRYAEAYRLFLFTQSEEEQKLGGYIFNGSFAPISSRRPFDWQIRQQPGLEIIMPDGQEATAPAGIQIRFLNRPVKTISLQQYLHLPPGSYRFSLEASGTGLKLPKDLFWTLNCVNPAAGRARLAIPEGSYPGTVLETDFTIEPGTCPLQLLRLETGLIAESWRYRYSGTLAMQRLHIESVQP